MEREEQKKGDEKTREAQLAEFKALLSLEQTLMSYSRTALTLGLVGITLIKLYKDETSRWMGVVVCILGLILFIGGFWHVRRNRRWVKDYFKELKGAEQNP